jgi:hypothetical protein
MPTIQDILGNLDDLKSALYDCEVVGGVDQNTCDQAQELLREVYALLEGTEGE